MKYVLWQCSSVHIHEIFYPVMSYPTILWPLSSLDDKRSSQKTPMPEVINLVLASANGCLNNYSLDFRHYTCKRKWWYKKNTKLALVTPSQMKSYHNYFLDSSSFSNQQMQIQIRFENLNLIILKSVQCCQISILPIYLYFLPFVILFSRRTHFYPIILNKIW